MSADGWADAAREWRAERDKRERGGPKPGASPSPVLPPPSDPMRVAREFVARHCLHEGGTTLLLRYWRDGWWAWRGACWQETERRYVTSLLYHFTEQASYVGKRLEPWAPTHRKIADLVMTDNDDLLRAYGRISRRERRERLARALAVVQAAQKAGLMIRGATIEGVELELGSPEPAKAAAEAPPRVTVFRPGANPKQKVVL